jgi:hypothetical protein
MPRRTRLSLAIAAMLLATAGAVTVLSSTGSAQTRSAWASSPGPVEVVVAPRSYRNPTDFHATIRNGSDKTIYWGGCVGVDRWPSRLLSQVMCLVDAFVSPHSSAPVPSNSFAGDPAPRRPGFYRLVLPYTTSPTGGQVRYAFAPFTVLAARR